MIRIANSLNEILCFQLTFIVSIWTRCGIAFVIIIVWLLYGGILQLCVQPHYKWFRVNHIYVLDFFVPTSRPNFSVDAPWNRNAITGFPYKLRNRCDTTTFDPI
jgi:hypothetical protein